jgi:hypothetical protein
MSPEELVYSTLAGAAAVTALVGDRIYPDEIPQERSLPAIVIRLAGSEPRYTLNDTAAPTRHIVRLACWHPSRVGAKAVGDAARSALLAQKIMAVAGDGFTDPETGEEAELLDVEVWL